MTAEPIDRIRRFNRTVSERVGVLHDRCLGRDRPVGEARLLWEIGAAPGRDVRWLRERIGLDSGYLSRLLRALERDGLVAVEPAPGDRRMRVARLTEAGRAERAVLDRRSDALAHSLLAPLNADQRARLTSAMAEVTRLLTAATVAVDEADPDHPDARHCLGRYAAELADRLPAGFDPGRSLLPDPAELTPPRGLFLVARLHGEPVGCAGLKLPPGAPAEIKRMWVDPEVRGLGVARRLLGELEGRAADHGRTRVRLDTNRALTEAVRLYRSFGFREVPPFNEEPYAHHWFEKPVVPRSDRPRAVPRPDRP